MFTKRGIVNGLLFGFGVLLLSVLALHVLYIEETIEAAYALAMVIYAIVGTALIGIYGYRTKGEHPLPSHN